VGLVTFDGELVDYELHHVDTHFGDDGEATQDAELWWTQVREATKRLVNSPLMDATRIKAIAVTGQWASTVPVDREGNPTGPCLTWQDTRGRKYSRHALGGAIQGYNAAKLWKFIRKTGGIPSTSGADPIGHVLFLENECPEICAITTWYMEPIDYLTMRFSGVASATHVSRIAMWLTDNRRLDHYEYDRSLLRAVGLSPSKLPPLIAVGSVVGPITPIVAHELGLDPSTVVLTAIPDLHAGAYGSGTSANFATHIALSTTSWVSCPVAKKKTDVFHSIVAVPGLTHDSYVVANNQDTGARALEWLQGILASGGERMSFAEMTALASTSPPGSNGVLFTPWLTGERSPVGDVRLRAGFTNLSITSTTADLIRSVMEGVAANSSWLFGYVEKFAGVTLQPVRLIGGGAQSDLWCQIFADTLGREVHQVNDSITAQLRGMALMASVSLERRTFNDLQQVSIPATIFHPDPITAPLYSSRRGVMASLYQRDKKWRRRRSRR
jgi:xylulokinase